MSGQRTPSSTFWGAKELRPTNYLYTALLLYRSYRLVDTSTTRSSHAIDKVKRFSKHMSVGLLAYLSTGSYPIISLDFLSRFVREANSQTIREAQALIARPFFMIDFSGVIMRSKSNKHLLRNVALYVGLMPCSISCGAVPKICTSLRRSELQSN